MNKTELIKKIKRDLFLSGYFDCLLWSSQDDTAITEDNIDGNFDEYSLSDCSCDMLKAGISDCEKFQRENSADLEEFNDDVQAGHCFALARNGHGAGFFDFSGEFSDRLQEASGEFKNVYLFLNNGEIDLQ